MKFNELEDDKEYVATAPNGAEILGTLERLTARSEIAYFYRSTDGEPMHEHGGGSELFWDSSETASDATGKTIYLCADGEEWTVDQLNFEEAE